MHHSPKKSAQNLRKISVFLCLALWIPFAGCSAVATVKDRAAKMAEALPFTGSHLKKRVAVIKTENRTFIGKEDIDGGLEKRFAEILDRECADIFLVTAEDPSYPEDLAQLSRAETGGIDNLALARLGSDAGLNAVVMVTVTDTDSDEREKGILIFRDTRYFGTLRADIVVYDTGTGAKLIDESITLEKEVDGAEYDAIRARNPGGIYEMRDMLEAVAGKGGGKVCKTMQKQPWQGYISAVEDGKILLSCGRETGIKSGDVFEVFDRGEIIKGKYGQQFYVPGRKTGEMTLTDVFVGKAEGMPAGDTAAKPGYFVRMK